MRLSERGERSRSKMSKASFGGCVANFACMSATRWTIVDVLKTTPVTSSVECEGRERFGSRPSQWDIAG
jgi:hypothetical protein